MPPTTNLADALRKGDLDAVQAALRPLIAGGAIPESLAQQILVEASTIGAHRRTVLAGHPVTLTWTDTAKLLGIGPRFLARLVQRGEVTPDVVDGEERFGTMTLRAYLAAREQDRQHARELVAAAPRAFRQRVADRAGLDLERAELLGL